MSEFNMYLLNSVTCFSDYISTDSAKPQYTYALMEQAEDVGALGRFGHCYFNDHRLRSNGSLSALINRFGPWQ